MTPPVEPGKATEFFLPLVLCVVALVACDFRSGATAASADDPTSDFCPGILVFTDEFDSDALDTAHWKRTPEGRWTVGDGWLHGAPGNKNQPLWLSEPLPERVRIEFDARADSVHGDLKVEVFGDGQAHESGYILIFGGWKNSLHVIARMDEHGKDRKAEAGQKVEKGTVYPMAVVRTGSDVRWYVNRNDRAMLMDFRDQAPLRGRGHDRFAFNNWDVPVAFDNVRVFDLGACP